jgi:hypothetical protein
LEQNRVTDYYECIPKLKANKMVIPRRSTANFYVNRLPFMDTIIKTAQTANILHLCAKKKKTVFSVGRDWQPPSGFKFISCVLWFLVYSEI